MSRRRQPGQKKDVVARLRQRVEEGDYYEALQLYKTSFARFKIQEKRQEAEELLVSGAVAMAKQNELNAATELGILLVESYEESEAKVDVAHLSQLALVAEAMTPGHEMFTFMKRAIRWTGSSTDEAALGLRLTLARAYLQQGQRGNAARCFAAAGAPGEYAAMLREWSAQGYLGERDLFVCRAVLHVLACNRVEDAAALWLRAVASPAAGAGGPVDAAPGKGEGEGPPEWADTPLCHLTRFLVELAQARAATGKEAGWAVTDAFTKVKGCYQPSIDRDPDLAQMVDNIGQVHFGVKAPKQTGLMGMLGEMMGGF